MYFYLQKTSVLKTIDKMISHFLITENMYQKL